MTDAADRPAVSRNYPKGERRRAQILAAALRSFGQFGYRHASMVQIAADCGVSRAGLLHHFPTKESLLEAVLQERDTLDHERFFGTRRAGEDGLVYFAALVEVVRHNQETPGIVNLFATLSTEASDPDHPAHGYFVTRYQQSRGDIRDAVADLAARGLLRDQVRPAGLDVELIALLDGLQVQWLLSPEAVDMPARFSARVAEMLKPAAAARLE